MSHRWAFLAAASGLALCLGAGLGAGQARAETLADAIAMAYQTNPNLTGQRAEQRALDETYVSAHTGLRPNVSVQAQTEYQREDFGAGGGSFTAPSGAFVLSPGAGKVEANAGIAQLTITQPLYTGGRTEAGIRSAEATVYAGREGLRSTEESVLLSVIQAYEDVLRDQKIVGIRRNNVEVLASQLDETNTKFQVGQVTRTDTAQAEAQLAQARALLTSAQAQLQISRAEYAAVVGQNPGDLAPPPTLPGLPPTVDQAFDTAEADNPMLKKAMAVEQASRQKVVQARAANRPTISLQGTLGYDGELEPFAVRDYDRAITAMATVTQPIFTGGLNASNIRAAIEQNNADRIGIETARRQVVQGVAQAWNTMSASHANIASNQEQVRSASVAFEGEQAEYRAGLRTTLDVLISQETLRDAELALVQAQHDDYVAEANLLSAMGRLEARSLVRGVDLYDPAKSFNRVKRIGAVPWDGVVEAIDSIGAPKASHAVSAAAPESPGGAVTMIPADQPVPSHQPLSTVQPTAPTPDPAPASAPAPKG
jgi:outer membrane protein